MDPKNGGLGPLVCGSIHRFGIFTTTGKIVMKCCMDIHGPQRMIPDYFYDSPEFSSRENHSLPNILVR